jgi:SAM-dependent methyltransferase
MTDSQTAPGQPVGAQGRHPFPSLADTQDTHFATRAASWTDRYRTKPSFRVRLNVVGRLIDNLLQGGQDPSVLDFGGGTGVFSAVASRHASYTVCVDRSLSMLAEGAIIPNPMQGVLRQEGFSGSTRATLRIVGDEYYVESLQKSFDLVLAIAVLEYVSDPLRTLAALTQRLSRGGHLLITVPNKHSPVRIAQRLASPVLTRRSKGTGWLADQSFVELRPHGDEVPWQRLAAECGLVLDKRQPLAVGFDGFRRWLHPTLILVFTRPGSADG